MQSQVITEDTPIRTVHTTSEPDLPSLLSTLLVELGVVAQQGDKITLIQNVSTLELEGGDGSCVTLELVEEDEVSSC